MARSKAIVLVMQRTGTTREWARVLGVSHGTVASWFKEGRIPEDVEEKVKGVVVIIANFIGDKFGLDPSTMVAWHNRPKKGGG